MEATTEIVVGLDSRGCSIVRRMCCEAPLLVRVVDQSGPSLNLVLVNGAAGPLGGDRLCLRLEVEAGASVTVRSVAAAMAQPGPRREPSELRVDLAVAAGASLDWQPQPTVSVIGSDHQSIVRLAASSASTVTMGEGIVLGRHGEAPGRYALHERVTIDDVAVLDHHTVFAPGALLGPGAHGPLRTTLTTVHIGRRLPEPAVAVSAHCLSATVHLSDACALTVQRS